MTAPDIRKFGKQKSNKKVWKIIVPILAVLVLLIVVIAIKQRKAGQTMISEFGKYQGYSEADL